MKPFLPSRFRRLNRSTMRFIHRSLRFQVSSFKFGVPLKTGLPHAGFDRTAFFLHYPGMASTFGQLFRIMTWGESHGGGVGVVVDGCPPRLRLSEADIQPDLDRRRPGQSKIVSPRKESDTVKILSGTFEGKTLGTPISMIVQNEDAR